MNTTNEVPALVEEMLKCETYEARLDFMDRHLPEIQTAFNGHPSELLGKEARDNVNELANASLMRSKQEANEETWNSIPDTFRFEDKEWQVKTRGAWRCYRSNRDYYWLNHYIEAGTTIATGHEKSSKHFFGPSLVKLAAVI